MPMGLYDPAMRVALLAVLLIAPVAVAAPKRTRPPKPTAADAPAASGTNVTLPPPEDAPDDASTVQPTATHSEGDYGGVKPGVAPRTDTGKKPKRPPPKGTLSWIGFEANAGNADIFLQSVAPFDVAQRVDNGVLVVDLTGLDKLGQNTWREVDTRFFDTPLARITAKRVGAVRGKNAHAAGIEVRVTFKNAKDAHEGAIRAATEADGMYYQYLSFAGTGGTQVPTTPDPDKLP
jgi:hypothetical protein